MKKVLPFLFFAFALTTVRSQSVFAPVGSHWNYNWMSHNGGYNGPRSLFYAGDTIIASATYKKIASAWDYVIMGPYPPMIGSFYYNYIYESNDSIFAAYPGGSTPMQLLYAFDQLPGDSILFTQSIPYKIVFDSVRTQFICNQNRRVLFYTKYENGCTDSVRIIEGIGPVNDYLFSQGIGNCELGPGSYTFICADITTCIYPNGPCTAVPLSISSTDKNEITMTVKRTNNEMIFSFSEILAGRLELYTYEGKKLWSEEISHTKKLTLPAENIKPGIYFARVISDKGNFFKKLLVE